MHHPHSVSKTVFQLVSTFSQEDLTFIQALNFSPRVVYPPSEDDEQFSDSSKRKGKKKGNTSTRVEFHEFPPGVSRQQNHLHANLTERVSLIRNSRKLCRARHCFPSLVLGDIKAFIM